jgi:hypothetical protein
MGYDPKTKKDQTWPYYSAQENAHKAWLAEVQDPITKEFYKGRETAVDYDNDGKEIPNSKKTIEKEPYFVTRKIIRIKAKDGVEYLYSSGLIYGFTTYGTVISTDFQEPEVWTETVFKHHMAFVQKENKHREICDGPASMKIHYTLPFTPDNVDKLMENADPKVALIAKLEGGHAIEKIPLEIFKNKSFDFLMNEEWYTPEQKEAARLRLEALQISNKKK